MIPFDWSRFDAVLFDLDGVLTSTAAIHAAAWKETFDEALAHLAGDQQPPFDRDRDYREYVDGRPRYEGVATFLSSRNIDLPYGDPTDPPGFGTICAVGNLKNQRLQDVLEREGVEAFPGSLALLDHLRALGLQQAVVSASANAEAVLRSAGLLERFPVRVDGVVAKEAGLAGKPRPDTFLEAARRVGSTPTAAVVVEDAVAGVEAGVAGGFGAVIGVDRHGDPSALRRAGADVVVSDLGELVPQ
ncbi:MAG: HAD family hydrolase [Actinomycetota bacterium]